jgi:hypothetical protein
MNIPKRPEGNAWYQDPLGWAIFLVGLTLMITIAAW